MSRHGLVPRCDHAVVTEFPTVRVAAVQATPVLLDADATLAKALALLGEAAGRGARLVVFPETFVPLYPSNAWAHQAATFGGSDELWERLWANSVDVPGPVVDELADGVRATTTSTAPIGVNERDSSAPGSSTTRSSCSARRAPAQAPQADADPCTSGSSTGSAPATTSGSSRRPLGRIGGLICWENRMPLARWRVYQDGPADLGRADRRRLGRLARDACGTSRSSRAPSSSRVPQYIPRSAFPADFPVPLPEGREVFGRGGAASSTRRPAR